jgi:hypothetical protein
VILIEIRVSLPDSSGRSGANSARDWGSPQPHFTAKEAKRRFYIISFPKFQGFYPGVHAHTYWIRPIAF